MPGIRSARSRARRRALLAVAAGLVATTGAGAVVETLAHPDRLAAAVHVEPPGHEGCPSAHNHLFCQAARSLSSFAAAPRTAGELTPVPAGLVLLPSVPERSPCRPAFLTDCVPRGPPLV